MASNVIQLILKLSNQMAGPLRAASAQVRSFGTATGAAFIGAGKSVQNFGTQVAVANRNLNHMNTLLRTAALIGITKAAIDAADKMTIVNTRLKLVTASSEELAAVQQELFNLAQRTRSGFSATVDLYARVARSSRQLGASQSDLIKFTTAVSESIQISGSTSTEAANGVIQFGQALASSRLSGDELRSVLEQMPRLARAIADGLGVSIGKLREMGQAGELGSARVFNALLSQADKLSDEFRDVNITIAGAATTVGNSMLKLVGSASDASQASAGLVGTLTDLADELAKPETAESLAKFATALVHIGGVAVDVAKKLGDFYTTAGEGAQILAEWLARMTSGPDDPMLRQAEEMNELLAERNRLQRALNSLDEDDKRIPRWTAQIAALEVKINRLNAANQQLARDAQAAGKKTGTVGLDLGGESTLPPELNRQAVSEALNASFFGSEKTAERIRENVKALQEYRAAFAGVSDEMFIAAGTTRQEFDEAGKAIARMQVELFRLSIEDTLKKGASAVESSTSQFEQHRLEIADNVREVEDYIVALKRLTPAQQAAFASDGVLTAGGLPEAERALKRLQAQATSLKFGDTFEEARDAIGEFNGDIEKQRDEMIKGTAALQDYLNTLVALSQAERDALVAEKIIDVNEIEKAAKALSNLRRELGELPVSSAAAAASEVFKTLRTDVQVVADEIAEQQVILTRFLEELVQHPEANAEAIRTVMEAQAEAARQGEENIRRARIGIETLEATARRSAEIVQEAFGGAVRSIVELSKPRDILKNFLDAILEIPIQVAAANIGAKVRESLKLDEWFEGLFGGGGTKGSPAGAASAVLGSVVGAGSTAASGAAVITAAQATTQAATATVNVPTAQITAPMTVPTMTVQAANVILNASSLVATIQQCISNCMSCGGDVAGGVAGLISGAAAGAAGSVSNLGGALGLPIIGRAGGGPVLAGGSYIVGEHGAEMLTMGTRSGHITPGGRGGGGVYAPTYNINVDSRTDRASVVADVTQILQEHDRISSRRSLDQSLRGRRY